MKSQLIRSEVKCINDCLDLAHASLKLNNIKYTKTMLEDALKSVNEIERLNQNETIVLVGSIMSSRNNNDN